MAQLTLSLETLGQLDEGSAGAVIDRAFKEAARDLDDRGGDGKPRSVQIFVTMTRRPNGMAEIEVEAEAKLPKLRTASTVAILKQDGDNTRMLFQAHAPDDPHQRTIDEQLDKSAPK